MPAKTEVAPKATFDTDDKRAQYARLVAFNHAIRVKLVKKSDADVNTVSDAILSKALDELSNGNMLDGKEGIELIKKLTQDGAEDENVAKRGLTTAYAQEVRPFIRRKKLSPSFGRRSSARKPKEEKTDGKKPAAKKAPAKKAAAAKKEPAAKAEVKSVPRDNGEDAGNGEEAAQES